MEQEVKKCGHCKVVQPLSEFYLINNTTRYESWCKSCKRIEGRVYDKQRRLAKPIRYKLADWKRQLKQNLTLQTYDDMLKAQSNKCAICGVHQSKLSKALGVDHDHKTGQIRGLLCSRCNFLVGYLETGNYEKALEYLTAWKVKVS